MHNEAISETFNPPQTGVVLDTDRVSVRLIVYIPANLQEIAA
jgi:hypothetical protein